MFVTSDEFNVLGKRVERMEAAVANVVRKVCLKSVRSRPWKIEAVHGHP